ncbi:mCG1030572 [Mus musculus]|nr:mCG1030572 [Mus musculus]
MMDYNLEMWTELLLSRDIAQLSGDKCPAQPLLRGPSINVLLQLWGGSGSQRVNRSGKPERQIKEDLKSDGDGE